MRINKSNQQLFPLLIISIFVFIVFILFSLPFLRRGFFPMMDDVQVVRINEMTKELQSGQFPVRYINSFANEGGYMLFNFYSPLPYYAGAGFRFLGFRDVWATKTVFILGIMIGLSGLFFLVKKYTNWQTALMSLSLLLTSSYVGYDFFQRGALAEIWGFMFFPWIFYCLLEVKKRPTFFNIFLASNVYALGILSHIAITFFFSIFLFLIIFIPPLKKKDWLYLGLALGLGLLFSAFFWLPFLMEKQDIIYSQTGYGLTQYLVGFLSPLQLIGADAKVLTGADSYPSLGLGLSILTLISSIYLFAKKKFSYRPLFIYFFLVFVISLLFALPITKPLWDRILLLKNLQSPWRFLTISTITAIFISALALAQIKKWWLRLLIIGFFALFNFGLHSRNMRPYTYNVILEYKAEGSCPTTTWQNEYFPKWVKKCLPEPVELRPPLISAKPAIKIKNVAVNNNDRLITFTSSGKASELTLAKYYYPSWEVTVDNKKIQVYPNTQYGLIGFKVPTGKHKIKIQLSNTTAQTIGNWLSLGSFTLIIALIIR